MNTKSFFLTAALVMQLTGAEILSHPNQQVSFPEPTIPYEIELDLDILRLQFPQNEVFHTNGLVGYFNRAQDIPIWTTPAHHHHHLLFWWYISHNDCPPSEVPEPKTWWAGLIASILAVISKKLKK